MNTYIKFKITMSVSTTKLFKIFTSLTEENALVVAPSTEKKALPPSLPLPPLYSITVPNHANPFEFNTVKPLMICLYYVHTASNGLPVLLFLLHKEDKKNIFSFISLPHVDRSITNKQLIRCSIKHIETLFKKYDVHYDARYAGFYETATNNILILRLKNNNINLHLKNTAYMWATSFEIFNTRHLGLYAIDEQVFTFFAAQPDFLFVYKTNGEVYETPAIVYYISYVKDIMTMDIYREYKRDFPTKSYFIFKDIPVKTHAMQHIMRMLLFVGNLTLNVDDYHNAENDTLLFQHDQITYYVIKKYIQHTPLNFM